MPRLCLRAFLLFAALALAPLPAASQTSPVTVHLEPRVQADLGTEFTRAVELTQQFFREAYSLDLTRPVRILLVPDVATYTSVMIREWSISQAEAERRARTTSGWTNRAMVIINAGGPRSARSRIFLTAHELTHQYQIQIAAPMGAWGLYWLTEGSADVLGARVVDFARAGPISEARQSWIETLRRARTRPDLSQMVSEQNWFATLDSYGSGVTYRFAAVAALYLAETKGYLSLINFYYGLRDTRDRAQAFQRAFHVPLEDFPTEYKTFLERTLQ